MCHGDRDCSKGPQSGSREEICLSNWTLSTVSRQACFLASRWKTEGCWRCLVGKGVISDGDSQRNPLVRKWLWPKDAAVGMPPDFPAGSRHYRVPTLKPCISESLCYGSA